MFKAKAKVSVAIRNSFVTIATSLVTLQEIVGSSSQNLRVHKRVQRASPRVRKDLQRDLAKALQKVKERWVPSLRRVPQKARQARTTQPKEKSPKLNGKKNGMRIGQKTSSGPLRLLEDAGEQGALCVSSAASARLAEEERAPQQRPFNNKELELLKTQKDFIMGKIWKSS